MEVKKILIISAHPEEKSFCMSLRNETRNFFLSKKCEVKESDLYVMNFNPVGDKGDFKSVANPNFFKYQTEQMNAFHHHLYEDNLKAEMDKLEWCDILIFNFPLWWFGLPAMLKGWVDRVFAMGFVYGNGKGVYDTGIYKDKTAFSVMTTGGPEVAYTENGRNGDINTILFPIHHGIFYFAGMTVLPPFISWSPAHKTDEERINDLARLKQYLENLETLKPIYTNRL
jgi:Putative NADPH-quinone reductase (modulator of drug activity B)